MIITDPSEDLPIFLEALDVVTDKGMDPDGIILNDDIKIPEEPVFIESDFFKEDRTETKIKDFVPFVKPKSIKQVPVNLKNKKKKARKQKKTSRKINRK